MSLQGAAKVCRDSDVFDLILASAVGCGGMLDSYGTTTDRRRQDAMQGRCYGIFITSYYNDKSEPPERITAALGQVLDITQNLPSRPKVYVTGTYDPLG
ncbi:hypothetical protein [Mycolicibacterium moriokaense]|uniref:Uncharacterized protein n=1 Tax=Mycolicibacterium moriokaense TaxID=39691 RepID=A0A318H5C0_9MYCO|nr:hypothetical protein [Mycolicibacterium moriokaense]PXW99120.1 hypothetical protein C8E89_1427 [Mycolicibacterium moriokaense]